MLKWFKPQSLSVATPVPMWKSIIDGLHLNLIGFNQNESPDSACSKIHQQAEISILGADQKDCSLWGRECVRPIYNHV